MISFIICEDNKGATEIYKRIINKALIKYDIEYKIYTFEKYNEKLKKIIEEPQELKIYIMDLAMPVKSGIEITKQIRKQDWDSQVIILTAHEELELRMLKQKLLIIDFISKFEDYEKRLTETIKLIIKQRKSMNTIIVKSEKIIHKIKLEDILYIYKENGSANTNIVTKTKEYKVRESLIKLEQKLDNRFCKTHRSCIVNKDKIKKINFKEKEISMEGNKKVDYLSRNYKKNLKV